jgi:hypothetical protein
MEVCGGQTRTRSWAYGIGDLPPKSIELVHAGATIDEISARFHLAMLTVKCCQRLRVSHGLSRVSLSGGTCQNLRLLGEPVSSLRDSGFEVFISSTIAFLPMMVDSLWARWKSQQQAGFRIGIGRSIDPLSLRRRAVLVLNATRLSAPSLRDFHAAALL